MTQEEQRPIFIVGASRSGTELMVNCLRRHPEIYIAGETHYFDDLRTRLPRRERSTLARHERERCENYFLAIAHRGYGRQGDPEQSPLDRAALRELAGGIGPGADAYFEAYCRLQAQAHGKVRWGEKTPRHVFRIPELLECFPHAKVVCMVRDPRAVVASYREWANPTRHLEAPADQDPTLTAAMQAQRARKQQSYDLVVNSLLWRSALHAATQAHQRFGDERVRLQRYEDLTSDPEEALRALAAWIKVDFSETMLDVTLKNSSFTPTGRQRGFAAEPASRWRRHLTDREVMVIQATCRQLMITCGYRRHPTNLPWYTTAVDWTVVPLALIRAVLANRNRTGNLPAYIWRRARSALSWRVSW